MKKVVFSLIAATTLSLGIATSNADASTYTVKTGDSLYTIAAASNTSVANLKKWNNLKSITLQPKQVLKTSANEKATTANIKSSTYKTLYNTNIRTNPGTQYDKVTLIKKGIAVTVTGQKKVGGETWYKVEINGKKGWALSSLFTKSTSTTKAKSTASTAKSKTSTSPSVVNKALNLKGIPYVFGGTTTKGFDCSGFVQYAFKKSGASVARTTLGQFSESTKVSKPKPGDLVFFQNTYRKGISHVGIYIGNNKFVHAGGKKSQVSSLTEKYWKSKFHSFKRL